MISKENFKLLLEDLAFDNKEEIYIKKFDIFDCELSVDFQKQKLIYPKALTIHDKTTSNFSSNENFVVFECVHRLLSQGYNPKHIELEPKWQVGHGASGGKADILIKDNDNKTLLIIECKTAGSEFKKAWDKTQVAPTQLFSYAQQDRDTKFIVLYTSDFVDKHIISNYYLLSLVDDKKYLFENALKKSYEEAKTTEEIYAIWSDTYQKQFKTTGIFESNKAYFIGLEKTTINDLNIVSSKDIQGKYNDFATIMRQHNIGSPERAFNVLVNLFLCKIIDENSNEKNKEKELKFYWKGISYDDAFGLQDRLQELYKVGMFNFLNEEITYISDKTIDDMFHHIDINSLKEDVKKRFREQKFFTNNDFSFLDVHSEMLFYKNFEVLLKVIELFQDIRLTGVEDNQFLGDMFEGFLDNGVKQSEGQFFTPMPIVKFILSSLPLEKIKQEEEKPKAIDYACGAGHFLNEVAKVFKDDEVVGIEKEYRLSKVAKVSALMYGQENINIIYNDALKEDKNIPNNSFSILVANPPYSVKGFLQTLPKEEREKFALTQSIEAKSYTANNSIECFFIERAKQLLKANAVAGIILPSSILSKGEGANTYVATREILLKYFDIIAICEFGSGTFGKTGTNTVTLFLRRRNDTENIVGRYKDLSQSIFNGDINASSNFQDKDLLKKYCIHIGIDYTQYKLFLKNRLSKSLLKIEITEAYLSAFEKSTETKQRRKTNIYKKYSNFKKAKEEKKAFISYVKAIETDKFYYFCLAQSTDKEVIIIKAPSDNKANKKFLGYEWSGRKGNEGIQYNGGTLNTINTVLYNPKNNHDESKINRLISQIFSTQEIDIPEHLDEFVSKAKMVDMLDFSRVEFSKSMGLSPNKKIIMIGKPEWQRKLGDIVDVLIGGTPSRANAKYFNGQNLWVSISEMNGNIINQTKEKISEEGIKKSNVKLIPKGTTLLSFKLSIGKTAIAGEDLYTNEAIAGLIPKNNEIRNDYLFHLFNGKIIDLEKDNFNTFGKSLNSKFLKEEVKIPLPPLNIQEEIVEACQKVDDEVEEANRVIIENKQKIEDEMSSVSGDIVRLGDLHKTSSGGTPLSTKQEYYIDGNIFWVNSGEVKRGLITDTNHKINQLGLDNSSAKLFPIDTVLIAMYGATVGQVGILCIEASTNQALCGLFPNKERVLPLYSYYFLKTQTEKFISLSVGTARTNISQEIIKNFKIPLPSITTQKEIIKKIEALEEKISKAQSIVDGASARKEAVLHEYL